MSVENPSVVIGTLLAHTKKKQNRRSSFGSSVQNAKIQNYIQHNIASNGTPSTRSMEFDTMSGYVPSFAGYLDIGFSIHVPCDHTMIDCRLAMEEEQQERLESLVMLYLCSQDIEMVISTAPNSLIHVCPFNSDNGRSSRTTSSESIILGESNGDEPTEPMIVWNLPKFDTETLAFDEHPEDSKTVLDMATNSSMYVSKDTLQYFTRITFTYPVYQWGSNDPSIADAIQDGFDDGVIFAGMLDSLLPWPDAIAAPIGGEPYIFWNEPLPAPPRFYDTTLPQRTGTILRRLGMFLMIANTLVCVLLPLLAHRRKRRLNAWAKQEDDRRMHEASSQQMPSDYLDTEAGVSAILLESRHYAQANNTGVEALHHQHRSNGTRDRNISGVEVDLKMVDHPSHLMIRNQSRAHSPKSPEEKEEDLLARARYRSAPSQGVRAQWYSSDHLLNSDDDYDDETDLQILDLTPPPPPLQSSSQEESEC